MIPLRDSVRSRSYPIVTKALILLNAAVFLWELTRGRQLPRVFLAYALIPARYLHPTDAAEFFGAFSSPVAAALPFLTSMFLHGGWMHLVGNMWTLWIFGDNVEDRLGHARFFLFYLLGGGLAGAVHVLTNGSSGLPTLGASGAVAAVMGAYFRFYPTARIEAIIPPFFLGPTLVLPAVVFLGWWFLLQFFNGAFSLASHGQQFGGIAWWAHIGGFLFGLGVCLAARRRPRVPPGIIEI
jgi:membrane associated rhomboid family serine protease